MFVINRLGFLHFTKSEVIHNHTTAFQRAIEDNKYSPVVYITERRWCSDKNMMVSINYTVCKDSVFLSSDYLTPVYSLNPFYKDLMIFRESIYKMMNHVNWIYSVIDTKNPYDVEYIYSFTDKELHFLMKKIEIDTVYIFYQNYVDCKISHLKSIYECTNIKTETLFKTIYTITPKFVLAYLEVLYKVGETWINASIYGGGSDMKSFFLNRLEAIDYM